MQALVDHPERVRAPVRPARPGLLPPGALHIGPGKTLAALMAVSDVLALGLAFALGAELADLIHELEVEFGRRGVWDMAFAFGALKD